MNLIIEGIQSKLIKGQIQIAGSKSESNRLLILQQLFPSLSIDNLSNSDDSIHLQDALSSPEKEVNIGHAGTAMRFLTAYFSTQVGTKILSGSERMHNRPIKLLVEGLRRLGAQIEYLEKDGYPPLKITGTHFNKDCVTIPGNISSQYISALLLVAPSLPNGLSIELEGEITSIPYINMTLSLLHQIGVKTQFTGQTIFVKPLQNANNKTMVVESDWSSASYFYSIVALSEIGTEITLSSYKKDSLQGDSVLAEIYKHFGVTTVYKENSIFLKKENKSSLETLKLDLIKAPDIAQTITVTCFGLSVPCELTGLHTLKIKETDRLVALQQELSKLGATITVTNTSLLLEKSNSINTNIEIETYDDHRMAMAFAPLGMLTPFTIKDAMVVTKSYTDFWKHLQQIGFQFKEN